MFFVGDKIVHPLHGAGVIESIEERTINGKSTCYYVLCLPVGGMKVMIPVDSCAAIGVRPVITPDKADRLIGKLHEIQTDMTQNWNRRYRENMLRIKSGDLLEVAAVIKGLTERDSQKGLSTGERKMLRSAKQILISEIVLSKDAEYDEVELQVDAALCG